MSANAFRTRLLSGTPVFVTTLDFPEPSAAEFLSELGVDGVAVDTEHMSAKALIFATMGGLGVLHESWHDQRRVTDESWI